MSDETKLLDHAQALRRVARESRATAQQLSQPWHREIVLSFADFASVQADELERLAVVHIAEPAPAVQRSPRTPAAEPSVPGVDPSRRSPATADPAGAAPSK